jgi:hypothetical protein
MSTHVIYDVDPEVEPFGQRFTIQGTVTDGDTRYPCALTIRTGAAVVTVFPTPDALDQMADLLHEQARKARAIKYGIDLSNVSLKTGEGDAMNSSVRKLMYFLLRFFLGFMIGVTLAYAMMYVLS